MQRTLVYKQDDGHEFSLAFDDEIIGPVRLSNSLDPNTDLVIPMATLLSLVHVYQLEVRDDWMERRPVQLDGG